MIQASILFSNYPKVLSKSQNRRKSRDHNRRNDCRFCSVDFIRTFGEF